MSNSGSGRYAHFSEPASEPLEDPRLAAYNSLIKIAHLYPTDVKMALDQLDKDGLTICWKVPGDD